MRQTSQVFGKYQFFALGRCVNPVEMQSRGHLASGILLLAVIYFVLGYLSLQIALPPGYATAIFPPAGLAVSAVFCSHLRLLPGVALGAFALNLFHSVQMHGWHGGSLAAALLIACGSSLQALAAASYLQRWGSHAMDSGRDILHFLFGMPVICVISASIAIPGLSALGYMQAEQALLNWLAWWIGDVIGVVLIAPLLWIFCGQPRALWWRRRFLLGLPILCGILISVLIYSKTSRWEHAQQMRAFHLHAQQAGDILQAHFAEDERFLNTIAAMFDDDDHAISALDFDNFGRVFLQQHRELHALSWSPVVPAQARQEFERRISDELHQPFVIRDFQSPQTASIQARHLPLTYLASRNQPIQFLGKDWLLHPQHAMAIARAERTRQASVAIDPKMPHMVWLHGAVFPQMSHLRGRDPNQALGMISLAMRIDAFFLQILQTPQFAGYLASLEDITEGKNAQFLLNQLARPIMADDYQRTLEFGGHRFRLVIAPSAQMLQQHRGWESWAVLASCLLLTSILSCMLLLVSGDQARIYAMVKERTMHLHEREARLQAILDHAADAILTVDAQAWLVSANKAAGKLFGFDNNCLPRLRLSQFLQTVGEFNIAKLHLRYASQPHTDLHLQGRDANGNDFPLALAISRVEQGQELFFVCILRDLTEQQRSQEKINHLAHHDPLTGLANRITLSMRLTQLLALARRNQHTAAVLFIDIDHFKKINDSHGHQTGDQFLLEVARRLQDMVRTADTIARFGGDEFVLALADMQHPDQVTAVANRIVQAMSAPFVLGEHTLHSGASVGIAMFPDDGEDEQTLVRNADTAMYVAKSQGRGNFQFFSPAMNQATHERLQLETRLWLALEQNEFELFLQPQIALSSGQLVGAEALIRWRHPEQGLIPPDRFIPVAEESNLIQPLGDWILQRAVGILQEWQNTPLQHLRLAVNLSARQCQINKLLPWIDQLLLETGIAANKLEMEITETAAMSDPEQTRELLRQLGARGIQVAIDDFGTGYSSLSYLKLFAIDRIKIDRSFVKDIETDPNDAVIVNATITLAHSLGLEVIAEGVESEAQCDFLRTQGCDEAQGFWFSRPLPLAEFIAYASKYAATPGQTTQADA